MPGTLGTPWMSESLGMSIRSSNISDICTETTSKQNACNLSPKGYRSQCSCPMIFACVDVCMCGCVYRYTCLHFFNQEEHSPLGEGPLTSRRIRFGYAVGRGVAPGTDAVGRGVAPDLVGVAIRYSNILYGTYSTQPVLARNGKREKVLEFVSPQDMHWRPLLLR